MEVVLVYHNPRWAKSREVVSLLKKIKKPFRVIEYLKQPFEKEDLVSVFEKLNVKPFDLIRKDDSKVKKELIGINEKDDNKIIELFLKYPMALERPIVILGNRAVIGRPPEKVYDLFELEKEGWFEKYCAFYYFVFF